MMYGAISNPTKSLQVDFPLNYTYYAAMHIGLFDTSFIHNSHNDILKSMVFSKYELASMGVYIDIQVSSITENKTQINIEVRRKYGSFDETYEVTNANRHIQSVMELISKSLSTSESTRNAIINRQNQPKPQQQTNTTSSSGLGFFAWIGLIAIVIFIIKSIMN